MDTKQLNNDYSYNFMKSKKIIYSKINQPMAMKNLEIKVLS